MVAKQRDDTAGVLVFAHFLAGGFFQGATQQQGDHGGYGADHKRDAPAPGTQFFFGEDLLQDHHHQHRQQLAADQGHVLERSKEATLALERDFTHVGGRGAVFAAHRQALEQSCHQQQRRGPGTDVVISGQEGDDQGAAAHHQHRDHHRVLAPVLVGHPAKQPTTDRSHQEPGGKHTGGVEQLHRGVIRGEKRRGKINRAEGIDVEVEPFDQVAGGRTDNRKDPFAAFFSGVVAGFCCHVFLLSGNGYSLDILCNNPVPQADFWIGGAWMIVPTLCVGMPHGTLRVLPFAGDAQRHGMHYHAERGNDRQQPTQ